MKTSIQLQTAKDLIKVALQYNSQAIIEITETGLHVSCNSKSQFFGSWLKRIVAVCNMLDLNLYVSTDSYLPGAVENDFYVNIYENKD